MADSIEANLSGQFRFSGFHNFTFHSQFDVTQSCHWTFNPPFDSSPPSLYHLTTIMSPTVIHVRAETKPLEHRTAITPNVAKKLVDDGYTVNVEKAPLSIFKDAEYEGTGASLVPTGSWVDTPQDHIIVGLKELPEEDFPLKHTVCPLCLFEYREMFFDSVM